MSKPIIFSADPAFEQLRDEGTVATFRSQEKQTGDVWVRRTRTGEKEFDAEITKVVKAHPAHPPDLIQHAEISGFNSVGDWADKIKELHGNLSPGYIHIIEKKEGGNGGS